MEASPTAVAGRVHIGEEGQTEVRSTSAISAAGSAALPVTVVVPCFEEEESLAQLEGALVRAAAELAHRYDLRFLFVDDGSTDGTWAELERRFGARADCTLLRHPENRGITSAILTGIRAARTEIVASIDSDCTYDPVQLSRLLPALADGVDLVTASPYHPEGAVRGMPRWRLFLSRTVSRLYARVLGQELATYTSCFRIYRRPAVVDLEPRNLGFIGQAELLGLLDRQGRRVVEVPAVLEVRRFGRSKLKIARTVAGHLRLLGQWGLFSSGWARRSEKGQGRRKPSEEEV
ncbi:MAG: glycosyltransferase family 2 protein [Holophagales bacterium]|nr:glycosyltransferase family 2 protein [Holophagales bacterium]